MTGSRQAAQFLHGYQSAWLPASLLNAEGGEKLTEALFALVSRPEYTRLRRTRTVIGDCYAGYRLQKFRVPELSRR
jgi:hypothetical protein